MSDSDTNEANGFSRSRSRSPVRRDDRRRGRGRGGGNEDKRRIFVSNIPYELKWQDVKDVFREKIGEVTFVQLQEENGRSTGIGMIEFADEDLAQRAIEEMHRYELKTRHLVVKPFTERDRMKLQRDPSSRSRDSGRGSMGSGGGMGGGMGGMSMGGGGMGGNMGGSMGVMGGGMGSGMGSGMGGGMGSGMSSMSQSQSSSGIPGVTNQMLQQLGIEGPVTNQIFVANLDYKVSDRKVKDIFKMAGNIISVELKMDSEGKSRGFGTVRFEHPIEAVQAISMFNGQILYDRAMSVRMDKMGDRGTQAIPDRLPSGLKSIGMGLGAGGLPLQNISQLTQNIGMGGGGSGSTGMSSMSGMGMDSSMGSSMGSGMGSGMGMNTSMGGNMNSGMGSGMGGMSQMGMGSSGMGSNMGSAGMSSSMGSSIGGMSAGMGGMGQNLNSGMMGSSGIGGGIGNLDSAFSSGIAGMGSGMMGSSMSGGRRDSDRGDRGSKTGIPRKGQEGCHVLVKNLPYSATWKDLKELFNKIGDVKFAEIETEGGKSKGIGVIRFGCEEDANRAVDEMHGEDYNGRRLVVRTYPS